VSTHGREDAVTLPYMSKRILLNCAIIVAIAAVGIVLWQRRDTTHTALRAYPIVSLGDSVAAGDGLPELSGKTAGICHQSNQAYPYVLVELVHPPALHQFACSGAQINNGILQPQTIGKQVVPAQIQTAVSYVKDSDVLITVGANDVGWSNLLLLCAQTSCTTPASLALFQARMTSMQSQLNVLLEKLASMHPHTVLLNTYYNLVNNDDTCLRPFGITAAKIQWINDREASLNAAIVSAAKAHHDRYATPTFGNHDICGPNSWIQGLSGAAPLHPTVDGQAVIASYDQAALR
jgi:lysophospholipase L1-like esterase